MSKYRTALLVKFLRERIGLQWQAMHEMRSLRDYDASLLKRVEGDKLHPTPETLENIMKAIDLPLDDFVYSFLEGQPMWVYIECDKLTQALDMDDTAAAEPILTYLEGLPGFESGVLRQFILSKRARLWELLGKTADQIFLLIADGMAETFENFTEEALAGSILVLEEPELMHTKARVYAREGDAGSAIRILEHMVSSLGKLPNTDREKERQYAGVLLSLSNCLIETGDYEKVLEICDQGEEYSASRKHGQLNPEFEFNKAVALRGLKRLDECAEPLKHAYFGYILLGEHNRAKAALFVSKEDFGINFKIFGADSMEASRQFRIPYSRGEPVGCCSLGTMIKALRKRAGLSLHQLSCGICSVPTLKRIENDECHSSIFTLEAIMQRLGRDINLYNHFFLSKEDFIATQLRDRINTMIIERNYAGASKLLKEFETMENVKRHNVLRQFVETVKAIIFANEQSGPHPDFPDMLMKALKITCPQFEESDIDNYHLTFNEIVIIIQYAGYLGDTGDSSRSAEIYERLRRNLNGKYVDEVEKAKTYSTVLFNCSTSLGRAGKRRESQGSILECDQFERTRRRLIELPGLAFNKGYNMLMTGEKAESLAYFAQAYYGASMFSKYGQSADMGIIRKVVEDHFGIIFD